jgi:hypothetical protein
MTHEFLKPGIAAYLLLILMFSCKQAEYRGKAWSGIPQSIPGKIECEYYDLGGEGVAYHDSDSVNNGSGRLNPVNGDPLNEFRLNEGVDISYTKSRDIDNNPFNKVEPEMGKLYVGWTVPGEWINYSVEVKESGKYKVGIMYTASGEGQIKLAIDNLDITPSLLIPSTRNDEEPVSWRQWHHWNRIDSLAIVEIEKGSHILKLSTVSNGNMNYDHLIFSKIDNN